MLLTRVLAILVLGGVTRHNALAGDIPLTGANFPTFLQIDSSTPSLPDFLAGVIRQRAAAADEEMARFREWSAATAQLEAQMANSSSYEPPKVQTAAAGWPRKIVNLKKGPSPPQPLNLNAKGARYPGFPTKVLPPPPTPMLFKACPSTYSVTLKRFGAKGDGKTDSSAALLAASKQLQVLYFPPGVYRIASSITLTKPLYLGAGAQLSVDAGVTLRLTQRPHTIQSYWQGGFQGKGQVMIAGSGGPILPWWFKRAGESDSDTLQRAVNSCDGSCQLLLTHALSLTKSVALRPSIGVASTQGGLLDGRAGAGQGLVVTPGKYNRPLQLATMWGFSRFALKFQGGVAGAEVQLTAVVEGGDGLVFAPEEGSRRRISNVWVTHLSATNSLQNSVVFQGTRERDLLKNCLVRANFILQGGFLQPDQQSAGVVVKGAVPRLKSTSVVFQAVEAAQFVKETKFVFLQNVGTAAAKGLVFQVPAWGGGIVTGGKIVEGEFQAARVSARMSGGVPGAAQFASIQGAKLNNWITKGVVGSAGVEFTMSNKPRVKAFNGGSPVLSQVFYLRAPITRRWKPGQVRTFYFFSVYAKTVPSSRMRYIPFRAVNTGVVLVGFENLHSKKPFLIKIKLRNAAREALPTWLNSHRFGVQIGP